MLYHHEIINIVDYFKIGLNLFIIQLLLVYYYFSFYSVNVDGTISKLFFKNFLYTSLTKQNYLNELIVYYAIKNILKKANPENIIYPFEQKSVEKSILLANKVTHSETKTYGFAHANYNFGHRNIFYKFNSEYLQPDILCTTGIIAKKWFIKNAKWPNNKVEIIGSPRNFSNITNLSEWNINKKLNILFVASYPFELKIFIKWLLKSKKLYYNSNISVKPYPYGWYEPQSNHLKTINDNLPEINISYLPLIEQIKSADLVLYSTTSAGIEAMFHNCLVIHLKLYDLLNFDSMKNKSSPILSLDSIELLEDYVIKKFTNHNFNTIEYIRNQKEYAEKIFSQTNLKLFK